MQHETPHVYLREQTKGRFSFQKILQNFLDSPSHRIFRYMHEALNIDKKIKLITYPLFSSPNSSPNSTMQKEDSLSHQNVGKCMEY
jgi:hypothetical protein